MTLGQHRPARGSAIEDAFRITQATFRNPANQFEIPGVIYDSEKKRAFVSTPDGQIAADVGDFIVIHADGSLHVSAPLPMQYVRRPAAALDADAPWSDGAVEDLRYLAERGTTAGEIAIILCRTEQDIRDKAIELGMPLDDSAQ